MRRTQVKHFAALSVSLAAALLPWAGCTPEAYRRDADHDVRRILRERKGTALGYDPESSASDAPAPRAARADYAKIPATAKPPDMPPAMTSPTAGALPYGPLGPPADETAVEFDEPMGYLGGAADDDGQAEDDASLRGLVYGPPAPGPGVSRFDLFASLKYAVQNSRDYQDQMEDLYLAALDVTLQRHLFAPRPFAAVGAEYTGGQADVGYRSALAATASAGVRQQLPYGGEVVAETLVRFVDALSGEVENGESADVVLSGTVPLLRGAGLVNLEPLIRSEREVVYAARDFEAFRRSFAVRIASQYFGLLAQRQSIANRIQNVATLQELLDRSRALYESGRLSALEVQRAEQSLLSGENTLIEARLSYANALDDFKIILGMDVNDPLEVVPVALEVAVPEIEGNAGIELAYLYRLELQTAKDRVSDAARTVEVARNGLLPDLDLTARANTGNRDDTPARQLDSRTLEYSAGVRLELPIDRLAERNAYRRALIAFDRAQRGFENVRDDVTAQVRADIRGVRLARSTLIIQQRAIDLALRRLENATDRLRFNRAGASTREVVEAQESLLRAQDVYDRAQANFQIRILEFLRDTGTLRVDPDAGELGKALHRGNGTGNGGVNGGNGAKGGETPQASVAGNVE